MISYNTLNNRLSQAVQTGDDLNALKAEWQNQLSKLDAFIEMFLERFGGRVIGERDNSPEWNLYSAKSEEYNNYARAIRNAEYFIAKQKL